MRVHVLTVVILAFAECLLCSESQETENGQSQRLSPSLPLSSSPVKAVANQTSLSRATSRNSSATKKATRHLSPPKVVTGRRRLRRTGGNHTFPVWLSSKSHLSTEGPSAPAEERPNNFTSAEAPHNSSSPSSEITRRYGDSGAEPHHSIPISPVAQGSLPISRTASSFLLLPRTPRLSSPVSRITQPSAQDSYARYTSPTDSRATDTLLPGPSATPDSGSGSRETFSSPPDSGAIQPPEQPPVPTSRTTHLSEPIFRTKRHFTPAFTARHHSVPASPATQNASHESRSYPTNHVQTEPSLDPTDSRSSSTFREMTSLVPSQSLSMVPVMPATTNLFPANPELSLKPVMRYSLPTLKGSGQASFVPDSENHSSSFRILSGNPRPTSVGRNSFNVDQDKSSHLSTTPTSDLLPVKAVRSSLPLSLGSSRLSPTKVFWGTSHQLKPVPRIPHNSFGKGQYLLASGRTDASQSPWKTRTASLDPQAKPSSSLYSSSPLSYSPSTSEARINTTTDTIIRILDSNIPVSSVNTNNETPRLKSHEEETATNIANFTLPGGNEVPIAGEITALADATPWDNKANTTAYRATGYFLNPENLANDFSKVPTIALTGINHSLDAGTCKEEREGDGTALANAASSVVKDNAIVMNNTDLLEEDLRALRNALDFLKEDDFTVINGPDWKEDYLADVDDLVALKEDSIAEVTTRIFTKGIIPRSKLPLGIKDAAIPMKDVVPFTTPREIPEDTAVLTSIAIREGTDINPTNDATRFFSKMYVRKSSTLVANRDKRFAFTTVAENVLSIRNLVTSAINNIQSIRHPETPTQQIMLPQFKPEEILPKKEDIATENVHTVLLKNITAPDKNVMVYRTQLWGDNLVMKNYTALPEINTTTAIVRIPSLKNVPTRLIPNVNVSMVGTAEPLLNNSIATPAKGAIIKDFYTITTMEDDSAMGRGQQVISGRVIPRRSTITPREDTKGTAYALPRMDETSAEGDTATEGDINLSAKAGTAMEVEEENSPNDNTLKTFILDDNDPKAAKDNSFMPQVNTAHLLVDRTEHATSPTQSDPKVVFSTIRISPSISDRTVATSRKVYFTGSEDTIPFVEENPEAEIKAPISLFRDDRTSRDITSVSMGGGRTSNRAKASIEEDTVTENELIPLDEYYSGSEKGIVAKDIPTSFVSGSNSGALDAGDPDIMGFSISQKDYDTPFLPLGDRVTIPEDSHSSLTQDLDSNEDPTPLLYEMTDRNPNVLLISSMKNLEPIVTRNRADVTTDGNGEIILKDQETATVKQNNEATKDIRFFLPDNSIPGTRRRNYLVPPNTDYEPVVRQTPILLDDNIKTTIISTPPWPKTSVSTITEAAMDSTKNPDILPAEKDTPKETENPTRTMNYIKDKHDSTPMEEVDPAKSILLTANTFKPEVSSDKSQETFHEKTDPFPRATRQPSELSGKNSEKIKAPAAPVWKITESDHNVFPLETSFFSAPPAMPTIGPIQGEPETTSLANGNHATEDGDVSEFRNDDQSTILEGRKRITGPPASGENMVTMTATTRDESENGDAFEDGERTTTTEGNNLLQGEEHPSSSDPLKDFSPATEDVFDVLVTEDDSIFPKTDSTGPITDISANPPNVNAFEAPVGYFISDATKSLPGTTRPDLKRIIIFGQQSMVVPDTTSFLPKISNLEAKSSIHKNPAPNGVSSFTPASAMPLPSNSMDHAGNPIAPEDEGISVKKRIPSSSNHKLALGVRTTTQGAHLKSHDDDNSIVIEMPNSPKGTHTVTSATDPAPISHTDDVTEFARSPTTTPATPFIKKAALTEAEAPTLSIENMEPKDGPATSSINGSPSTGDKDMLTTTHVPRILKYEPVIKKSPRPFLTKSARTKTTSNAAVPIKSPTTTPEGHTAVAQSHLPANTTPGVFRASHGAPAPATVVGPGNSTVGNDSTSLLSDGTSTPPGRVPETSTPTSPQADIRNMGAVNKDELGPPVEKDKTIEPETPSPSGRRSRVGAKNTILPTKYVAKHVKRMTTPLPSNILKDRGSGSEDSRTSLTIDDADPITDITVLTYGPKALRAHAPHSPSRIIIIPSDVGATENHHTVFMGDNDADTEADTSDLIGELANLQAVNPRTMDDSTLSQTLSFSPVPLGTVAIAANDADFIPEMSDPRVKKTLHSSVPDALLKITDTRPYITDSTDANRKDKLPLVRKEDTSATYDAVGLHAAIAPTAAEPRTQKDESRSAGPELANSRLGMEPMTSFPDSVIEREEALSDLMTTGAIERVGRVTSTEADDTSFPGKGRSAEGQFINPGAVSKVAEPVVENIKAINKGADPGGQIFKTQRYLRRRTGPSHSGGPSGPPASPLPLTADSPAYRLSPTSSEHSSPTIVAATSMPVRDNPTRVRGPKDNSRRQIQETMPTEGSSYTGTGTTVKEEMVTPAERIPLYGMASADFLSGNAVNRTGGRPTNSLLPRTDRKMAGKRKSTSLRRKRVGNESNVTKSPNDRTNSKTVATETLVKATPGVQEIVFVGEKNGDADKVVASFLPDSRGPGNIRSYDTLSDTDNAHPDGDTSPDSTGSEARRTTPRHEAPNSSENATGPTDHTSGTPATTTAAVVKAHTKENGTAVAKITSPQDDFLPLTPTSIPVAEGYRNDGTENPTDWVPGATVLRAARLSPLNTQSTEAGKNQATSEGDPSLSTAHGSQLSAGHPPTVSDQLHVVRPAKEALRGDIIRTPTGRRKITAKKPSTTRKPNRAATSITAVTPPFPNTDTIIHVSGPEHKILTEKDSRHEPEGKEEEQGDKSIPEIADITPFLSHDSVIQRDNLAPTGYLINSEEDTDLAPDSNGFLTHRRHSLAKAINLLPGPGSSEFEEIILEKDDLANPYTSFLLPDISYPEKKRNALRDGPEGAKSPVASSRDLALASPKTEAFASKDKNPFHKKMAHGQGPKKVSGPEIKKTQVAVAVPVVFFTTPEADRSHAGANTKPLINGTATSVLPTKRSTPPQPKPTTIYTAFIKPINGSPVSGADPNLTSRRDTTLLTEDPLKFNPGATAGSTQETLPSKETSRDNDDMTVSPVSEKPLPGNGAPIPGQSAISAQRAPHQALRMEPALPPAESTLLPSNPAYTDPDTAGTVREETATEAATSGEKDPSPKRVVSAAATINLREDSDSIIGATIYEPDILVEKITSDEQEGAFQREEEDAQAGDDATQEEENTPYYTYSSPFVSNNNVLGGRRLDPEDGYVFNEANNNHVVPSAVHSPSQITPNRETKAGDSISPRDEKPSTAGDSAARTADGIVKTMPITADTIPDGMIKPIPEFKGITNSEAADSMTFLPDVAYLLIKRKAQKHGDAGPTVDSPSASEDTRATVAGSSDPVISTATPLKDKEYSMLVPGDHVTNTVADIKSPSVVGMANSQKERSPVTSFAAPTDVRMPYVNTQNKSIRDLAAKEALPLRGKAPAVVSKDALHPSQYIKPKGKSTASTAGATRPKGGSSLPVPTKRIPEHLAPSDQSQISDHSPITSEAREPRAKNSLPNDAATLGRPLTKMEADPPALPLAPSLLPDDPSTSMIKALYTRHAPTTAGKGDTKIAMVPGILATSTNVPGRHIRDRVNPSSYQPDNPVEISASMEYDEIPFVKEDTSDKGDGVSLAEENTSSDELVTLVLDNNVSAYVTEDYIIAPPRPIIKMTSTSDEPSELGTYASYNKADHSYSSSEVGSANPIQTNSIGTSHTIIPEYEPPDSGIHTTILKSVAPRTMAYSNPDGGKKMSSKFLKMTTTEQDDKVVDDATTFLPETPNPRKKRTNSPIVLDPDTGFPIEESRTFTMDNFGSAGEPAPYIKNKDVFDSRNMAADVFTPGRNTHVTAVEAQYLKDNFKIPGSEITTSQDNTIPSGWLIYPGVDRTSYMEESMAKGTDPAVTEKVNLIGDLPIQGGSPIPRADVAMSPDDNPLLTRENPSLAPDAKSNGAAASPQGTNVALLDDLFIESEETEMAVEQMETLVEDDTTSVPEITLLSNNANTRASEDNVIQVEESLSYDTDLMGGGKSNSEDNYIILEPNGSNLNMVLNSCLTNTNGLEAMVCSNPTTHMEKNGEDEFDAKNLPADKAKVPTETITMADVIIDGITTTPQEIPAAKEGNRAAIEVTSLEPDMPLSETAANTHKGDYIASDWEPTFPTTDRSSLRARSTLLAENITPLENQETSITKDTRFSTYNIVDPRAEPTIPANEATSEEKEEHGVAEITNLENAGNSPTASSISHKIQDIEPSTNSGLTDAITPEEETTMSMFSPSTLYTGYIKAEHDPTASGTNSAPASTGDTPSLRDSIAENTQEALPSKETSWDDDDMTVSPVSEKPLPGNGAPIPGQSAISAQRAPHQALRMEPALPPAESTLLPSNPAYTDPDTAGMVREETATEAATSGEKDPSPKRAVSAAATINLREDSDSIIGATIYEPDILVEKITSDEQEGTFQREEEDAQAGDDATKEEENTLYTIDFSPYISSSNIPKGNELDPQDYSIFPKREDVNSISEVSKIKADLSKFVAQPASLQKSIPVMTSFSVPGADRISFGKQDLETLSYSDLPGGVSSMAQVNPTMTKVLTPTSLPNRPGGDFLISGKGSAKSNEDTNLPVDTINILQDEFTTRKAQDTLLAKDDSLADLKIARSYLLNPASDRSAPMNNLGIPEGSVSKSPTHIHAFSLDASRENTVSSVDSAYTEYDPSATREDSITEMSFDTITTSPGSPSLRKKLPMTSVAALAAEDSPSQVHSPIPTADITRNRAEETIFSVDDSTTPKVGIAITSEGSHHSMVEDSIPESGLITTAVNLITSLGDFVSSMADKFTLVKKIPTSDFNTRPRGADTAEGDPTLTNTAVFSADADPLNEEEVISYVTGSISSISNDVFLTNDDDDAIDPANDVSDFIVHDLKEGRITKFDRTTPAVKNAMAKVNGFIQKDGIAEERDTLHTADLTNSEEDTTANSTEEDSVDNHRFWMEGNPEDELNATAFVLSASKTKDHSVSPASEAKNTWEDKNTIKAFFTKLARTPTESITNAAYSSPGSPTARRTMEPGEDSTTEIDVTNLEEDDSENAL